MTMPDNAEFVASGSDDESEPLLRVERLAVRLPTDRGMVEAVRDVSLAVGRGERVGIVGESGSGKSVTGRAVAGLLPSGRRVEVAGRVEFDGVSLLDASADVWREVRSRRIGLIFQDPLTFLNPVMKVGAQVREAVRSPDRSQAAADVLKYLELAGLPDPRAIARTYPHELSGGMRQRVLIAFAIAKQPDLIIADEPTTALDATVQQRVLATLDETVRVMGASLILISHDLAVVASVTDRIYVMYAGRVVESGATRDILTRPRHPYTQALIRSVRSLTDPGTELWSIDANLRRELDEFVKTTTETADAP